MAKKRITAVRLVAGAPATGWQPADLARVTFLEDGGMFPADHPVDRVVRAINAGEAYYLRDADGTDTPVTTRLRHGKYTLEARPDPAAPDRLLALPTY